LADVVLSIVVGLQVPVIPLPEVVGKLGTAAPLQMLIEVPKVNIGVILGVTFTVNDVALAHCPPEGVKV
jgi:hypothetical protein